MIQKTPEITNDNVQEKNKNIIDFQAVLKHGKRNAIKSEDLARMLHLKDKRILQTKIAEARLDGQIILSSTAGGYYLPSNDEEIQEFIRTLQSRALNTLKVLKVAKKVERERKKQVKGQIGLEV